VGGGKLWAQGGSAKETAYHFTFWVASHKAPGGEDATQGTAKKKTLFLKAELAAR